MNGPIIWTGKLGRFEESGGTFVLTLESGGETFRFAMSPHLARGLCFVGLRTLDDWEASRAPVAPFRRAKNRKAPVV